MMQMTSCSPLVRWQQCAVDATRRLSRRVGSPRRPHLRCQACSLPEALESSALKELNSMMLPAAKLLDAICRIMLFSPSRVEGSNAARCACAFQRRTR